VTFNDHKGSTKSYAHTYEFYHQAIHADYIQPSEEIKAEYDQGAVMPVELHDGSTILLKKADEDLNPRNAGEVLNYIARHEAENQIVTGLLHIDDEKPDMNACNNLPKAPLNRLPYEKLSPGAAALAELQKDYC
jgi:2-oxoglutarate ferredoxin oxidoreductase subunit beta